MMMSILMSLALLFIQTPEAQSDDTNVFLDLGSEHCATEIAFAAYENVNDNEIAAGSSPDYMTYSAFQFESADQATSALDDVPDLVAETFSDEPDITESEEYDRTVVDVETEEYGDESVAYLLSLPVDNDELEVLSIELLGIVKADQMLLILLFSDAGTTRAAPGVTLETVPPFAADLEESWDGSGDLQDAIPDQEDMPIDWEGRQVTVEDPPAC